MSTATEDIRDLAQSYTRLSEKFKVLWTFHQCLQGIHKAALGGAPSYRIDFQALYDQIKKLSTSMNPQAAVAVGAAMVRLDGELQAVHRQLEEEDAKISPSSLRRFFEKVRTDDERLLISILRFYFFAPFREGAARDLLDKVDFLLTLVGARRSLDDGRYYARFPQELQKLIASLLPADRRVSVDPTTVAMLVGALQKIRHEIDSCEHFEELAARRILQDLRALKHGMGEAFFHPAVVAAVIETNLAAKNRFRDLYEAEERKIQDSSRQLLEIEQELAREGGADDPLRRDFEEFRRIKEDFEKQQRDGLLRYQEVTKLVESMEQLLSRVRAHAPAGAPSPGFVSVASMPVAENEVQLGEFPETRPAEPAGKGSWSGWTAKVAGTASRDPLTAEFAAKILYSVDLVDDGTGSGRAAHGTPLARLRLEPWEIRAARRILRSEPYPDDGARGRDLLYFDAAALRLRIDEEAQRLRTIGDDTRLTHDELSECGRCLVRAQETDRQFRQALEATDPAVPEKVNEINRSRFRMLRAFSGLWLLHNQRVAG